MNAKPSLRALGATFFPFVWKASAFRFFFAPMWRACLLTDCATCYIEDTSVARSSPDRVSWLQFEILEHPSLFFLWWWKRERDFDLLDVMALAHVENIRARKPLWRDTKPSGWPNKTYN
jgi:hypothetical protein